MSVLNELAVMLTSAQLTPTTIDQAPGSGFIEFAKKNNLVVVFAESDDLLEVRGAIFEEVNVYGGGEVVFFYNENRGQPWRIENTDDENLDEQISHWAERQLAEDAIEREAVVKVTWGPKDSPGSWALSTKLPHEYFTLFSEGKPYCRGLVLAVEDIQRGIKPIPTFAELMKRKEDLFADAQYALDKQLEKLDGQTVYLLEPFDLKGGTMDEAQMLEKVYFFPSGATLVSMVEHSEGTEFTNALNIENTLSLVAELEAGNYQTTPLDDDDDDDDNDDMVNYDNNNFPDSTEFSL